MIVLKGERRVKFVIFLFIHRSEQLGQVSVLTQVLTVLRQVSLTLSGLKSSLSSGFDYFSFHYTQHNFNYSFNSIQTSWLDDKLHEGREDMDHMQHGIAMQ